MIARCAGREQFVDHGEPQGHGLEGGSQDLDTCRVQTQAADRSPPVAAPSGRPLPGQVREHSQAVTVRRQRGECGLDLLVGRQL